MTTTGMVVDAATDALHDEGFNRLFPFWCVWRCSAWYWVCGLLRL